MTNTELLAKIKAEIKGRINSYSIVNDKELWIVQTYMSVLSFLSTLEESEKPMDGLEKEIEREWNDCDGKHSDTDYHIVELTKDDFLSIARHFAQWGAEHLADNKVVAFKLGDEIAINGYKLIYDKNENAIKVAKVEPSGSSEDLEEAAEKYAYGSMPDEMKSYVKPVGDEVIKNFIAGAKWQADHTTLPEDTVLFQKGVEEGKKAMKEQMMKGAVEGEFTKDNRGNNVVRAGVFNKDFEYGDKVRVIVCKKEDKKDR